MISAISMLGSEMIHKFLLSIPGFNVFLSLPIPFTDETIGDALSLCISAAGGAVLSTIAIFYMDKWRSNSKIGNLQIQIVTQKNLIVQYKIAKTWFALNDAYHIVKNETLATIQQIKKDNQIREQSSQEVETAIEEFENCNITKKLYKNLIKLRRTDARTYHTKRSRFLQNIENLDEEYIQKFINKKISEIAIAIETAAENADKAKDRTQKAKNLNTDSDWQTYIPIFGRWLGETSEEKRN